MVENLFWQKYRPKSLEDMILLPRIENLVKGGIQTNLILHGHYGTGKTALAKILCKRNPSLEINSSIDTSIDVLRNQVSEFVSHMSMFDGKDDMKIVFLDEVDRVSAQYQDALKAFIEDTSSKVRYIFTTNHIEKITPGNLSRFTKVAFDPQDEKEVKFLKNEYAKRLLHISTSEKVDIDKTDIVKIVNRSFPDLREMVNTIQEISITGVSVDSVDASKNEELFNTVMNNKNTNDVYHFLINEYGEHNISHLMNTLGRPFIEYVGKSKSEYIPKMVDILEIVTRYTDMLDNRNQDPVIVALTCITQIQKIL